jgi:hypothetical protein
MGLIDTVKETLQLVDRVQNVDLYKRLVDLQREAMEFTEQLRSKDETIVQLRQALELKGKLTCKGSVYFIADEKGDFIDGPFCTTCFDVEHLKCRVVAYGKYNHVVQCLKCKAPFDSLPAAEYLRKQHSSQ